MIFYPKKRFIEILSFHSRIILSFGLTVGNTSFAQNVYTGTNGEGSKGGLDQYLCHEYSEEGRTVITKNLMASASTNAKVDFSYNVGVASASAKLEVVMTGSCRYEYEVTAAPIRTSISDKTGLLCNEQKRNIVGNVKLLDCGGTLDMSAAANAGYKVSASGGETGAMGMLKIAMGCKVEGLTEAFSTKAGMPVEHNQPAINAVINKINTRVSDKVKDCVAHLAASSFSVSGTCANALGCRKMQNNSGSASGRGTYNYYHP